MDEKATHSRDLAPSVLLPLIVTTITIILITVIVILITITASTIITILQYPNQKNVLPLRNLNFVSMI